MKIPKIISKNGRKYEYVKVYPNYIQYRDVETKKLTSFQPYDLGLIKPVTVRPRLRKNMNMKP